MKIRKCEIYFCLLPLAKTQRRLIFERGSNTCQVKFKSSIASSVFEAAAKKFTQILVTFFQRRVAFKIYMRELINNIIIMDMVVIHFKSTLKREMITDNPIAGITLPKINICLLHAHHHPKCRSCVGTEVTSAGPNFDLHKKLVLSPQQNMGKRRRSNNIFNKGTFS